MEHEKQVTDASKQLNDFLAGKSAHALLLYNHFVSEFKKMGDDVSLIPTKTMVGVANSQHRIAWITQLGKSSIHVVFPFKQLYPDNTCFIKMVQVPGDAHQFNHHFRMTSTDDLNEEIKEFMLMAYHFERS